MQLADLQRLAQAHVLDGGDVPDALAAAVAPPAAERWRIYTEGYRLRLIEALASQYPAIAAYLGEARFVPLATAFIESTPSVHRSIRDYGSELAAFLRRDGAGVENLVLADLAAFEWQLEAAFDSPAAMPTGVADLAGIAPADWPGLRFRGVPSLRRLRTHSNAVGLWRQLTANADTADTADAGDAADAPPVVPEPATGPAVEWLISRRELTTEFRSLDAAEAGALDALLAGATFGELCETLAAPYGEAAAAQAAGWLKGWLVGSLLVRI